MKSKKNGNSIFLPSAGYRTNGNLSLEGYDGYYWSSSLDPEYGGAMACCLSLEGDGGDKYLWYEYRCFGQSVRAVCP